MFKLRATVIISLLITAALLYAVYIETGIFTTITIGLVCLRHAKEDN